jgi:ABC-type transport system involved in Fe-S cluster assembly fused permease/ATPase subunit
MFSNTNNTPIDQQKFSIFRLLSPYLWRWKWRVLAALLLMMAGKLALFVTPITLKYLVDGASSWSSWFYLPVIIVIVYGASRFLSSLLAELREIVFVRVTQDAVKGLSLKVFEHLQQLSLNFHLERQTGRLTRDLERGSRAVDTLTSYAIYSIFPTLLEILMVLGYFWFSYDMYFVLITLLALFFYTIFTIYTTEWRANFRQKMNELDSNTSSKAVDALLNYETVKYFGNEPYETERYNRSLSKWQDASIKYDISLSLLNLGQATIIAITISALMARGLDLIFSHQMTIGDLVLINTLMLQLYMPLNFLGMLYREIKQGLIDVEKLDVLLKSKPDVVDSPEATPLVLDTSPSISFNQVDFFYQKDRKILNQLSFEIPAGTTTAVVGASGAGKSTLLRLIFRFYDVSSGHILINGQDVRVFTQRSLRQHMGVVPQDTVLFNDTIYYNIAYGRPTASKDEIIEAAKKAQIHDLITRLPQGYDTQVGERGLKLSGGEKQRVAIARTLLKNPSILIFDEATSALDTHAERAIQSELDTLRISKTTLIIAHRLSTIVNADQILVMSNGEIIERGTHTSLLAQNGTYASMWLLQQQQNKELE